MISFAPNYPHFFIEMINPAAKTPSRSSSSIISVLARPMKFSLKAHEYSSLLVWQAFIDHALTGALLQVRHPIYPVTMDHPTTLQVGVLW
jgi:hypothetical protein